MGVVSLNGAKPEATSEKMDENSFSNKETKQPTRANMKILKASSNVKSYWSCEFFIKLVSKYETPIFGSIDSEVGPKIKKEPNSLNEVLELHGVTSNLRAIQSKEEFEVRRRVEEILANEAPSIKQQTSLHKIFWYRIWLFLVLQGVLKKDSFIEHYASWRENKGARYFEVLCYFENKATYQKSIPIDIFLLGGIPSKEEIEAQIELAEPLISRPLIKNKNKRSIEKIVGRKNLGDIKISIDKAVTSGKIAGLVKAVEKNSRHKYRGNRNELYRDIVKNIGLQTKESMFVRAVSLFVETKAK